MMKICQMSSSLRLVVCFFFLGVALAFPLVEDEDGNFVELIPLRRVPRGLLQRPHQPQMREGRPPKIMVIPRGDQPGPGDYEPMTSSSRKEPITAETGYGHGHSQSPYDYVDYGAYTGGYGAFGWYTDHPVYTYGHSGY